MASDLVPVPDGLKQGSYSATALTLSGEALYWY